MSRSSLTSTRLAALSLSPSRIAQLGVAKHDHEGSLTGNDSSKHHDTGNRESEAQEGQSSKSSVLLGAGEGGGKRPIEQNGGLKTAEDMPRRPNTDRRKSSLNSLDEDDDEGEERSPRKESGMVNGVGEGGLSSQVEKVHAQEVVSNRQNKVNGDTNEHSSTTGHQSESSSTSSTSRTTPPSSALPTIHISSDVPTSPSPTPIHDTPMNIPARPRSPPPSYDFATSPSALHRSSPKGYAVGGSPTRNGRSSADSARFVAESEVGEEVVTSRRKGKQRAFIPDDLASSHASTSPPASLTNRQRTGNEHAMLELLPNSDTEGEGVTNLPQEETSDTTGPSSRATSPPQTDASSATLGTAERLRPLLLPQARTRSFTPPLSPSSILVGPSRSRRPGSRRAYTGPVQIIDRTGESEEVSDAEEDGGVEGWVTPMSGADVGTGTNTPVETTGYHLSPSIQAISPTSPLGSQKTMITASSASERHLPNPTTDVAFTADVYISGWKIIGGRTKGVVSPSALPSSNTGVERDGMGRSPTAHGHGHDVVELQKGRLGAYVGTHISALPALQLHCNQSDSPFAWYT
ncbi:hypothetical protein QFC21_006164 [Naganishia friedmannii]|uniref:Uncharacterized protein n=1 Tax=Naganishia friedmannii TaxID=89922 RepID=A0ACC2V4N4_9TREE|nr:hypothetical protein QFC21_006164 [Naganishia friedmannii]